MSGILRQKEIGAAPLRRHVSRSFVAAIAAASALLAPAKACDSGPFRIFFDSGSARLSPGDESALEGMELMAGGGFIRLSGHADTAGPAEENWRLAKRRVDGARRHLISLGMPPSRIITRSFGESHSGTALHDGLSSRRHRFVLVEIVSATEARKGKAGRASTTCGG